MKKWMIGSLLLVALMVIAAGVYAQTSDKEKKQPKTECKFVDKDNNGNCDTCGMTADQCKKEGAMAGKECAPAASAAGKDCAKCPSAAACAETKGTIVPAKESASAAPCCPAKK